MALMTVSELAQLKPDKNDNCDQWVIKNVFETDDWLKDPLDITFDNDRD